jgi:hypothetical protein
MSYDSLAEVTYTFPGVNFATTTTGKMKIPRSAKMARVLDIFVNATVLFTQVTTQAIVQVGDGSTPDIFASLALGALAATNTIGGSDVTAGVFKAVYLAGNYNSGAGLHDLIATFVAPTGGTPAGTGTVTIVVGYDQISP